ncbi:hypothetical protein Swit_0189 [Rhizorhabdus wittichii RW1]|uniref:Uncharacterized protein n=1 Tax=Rhizorhabdus wittichii (strain DSM 6014 / CCUG 31198 / JCM 15750 / NBRC 105917 / EY 4224 / RW1) TaxID=392499 RepID=A0A9J9LC97_RHIWR|nr:hypothetical protein Swit_0189 [Rhizorhabdus wittichii RW1]
MPDYRAVMSDQDFEALIDAAPFATGSARVAYEVPSDADVVVKKSKGAFAAANLIEWFVWRSAETQNALQAVLGRCLAISESGAYLMMERLDDITKDDYADVPDVPTWFNDPKPNAFGKRNGAIKIRDYGLGRMERLVVPDLTFPPAFAVNARTARRFGR